MNEALKQMLSKYDCERLEDYARALREILQEIALLGLWRAKFFEKGAFYGGTALRILHGSDRFSEDLDFSLLKSQKDFRLDRYIGGLEAEVRAFGFDVQVSTKPPHTVRAVQSAFLKTDTLKQLILIEAGEDVLRVVPRGQTVKIKIEVDTDPPLGFETEVKFLLLPIPFSVRTYTLPDLFAGKMHAVLCRRWQNRAKGRDWFDLVWYVANHPELRLAHLESRMRQTGHIEQGESLTPDSFRTRLRGAIDRLDVDQTRKEVEPFVKNPVALEIWSHDFFHAISDRIKLV